MINSPSDQYDVLVVGAGMVGVAIACGLGQQGLNVAIFDHHVPEPLPEDALPELRVSALSKASENILRQLGAWEPMQGLRMTPYRRMAVWEKLPASFSDSRINHVVFDAGRIGHSQLGYIVENRVTSWLNIFLF